MTKLKSVIEKLGKKNEAEIKSDAVINGELANLLADLTAACRNAAAAIKQDMSYDRKVDGKRVNGYQAMMAELAKLHSIALKEDL
jgi:hypothetical protein